MNKFLYETARQLIALDTVSAHSNLPAAEMLANLLEARTFGYRCSKSRLTGWRRPTSSHGPVPRSPTV